MSVQQKIAFRHNEQRVGARCDVIVDHAADGQDGLWVGRPASDAPEIDGIAYVTGEALTPGDIVSCEIVGADGYDLIAYALEPAAAGG